MPKKFFPVGVVAVVFMLLSCSSPKYTYNFDHYNYTSEENVPLKKISRTPNP